MTRFEDVYRRLRAASDASPGPALVREMFVGERFLDADLPRVLAATGRRGAGCARTRPAPRC